MFYHPVLLPLVGAIVRFEMVSNPDFNEVLLDFLGIQTFIFAVGEFLEAMSSRYHYL